MSLFGVFYLLCRVILTAIAVVCATYDFQSHHFGPWCISQHALLLIQPLPPIVKQKMIKFAPWQEDKSTKVCRRHAWFLIVTSETPINSLLVFCLRHFCSNFSTERSNETLPRWAMHAINSLWLSWIHRFESLNSARSSAEAIKRSWYLWECFVYHSLALSVIKFWRATLLWSRNRSFPGSCSEGNEQWS